mgnify:CR=1 FL=1
MATVTRCWALTLIACSLLAGCGLTQTVTDGTVSITKSIFYKKNKTLHLDFTPRTAINADGAQTPLATMVRIYQLRDRKAVDAVFFPGELTGDDFLSINYIGNCVDGYSISSQHKKWCSRIISLIH